MTDWRSRDFQKLAEFARSYRQMGGQNRSVARCPEIEIGKKCPAFPHENTKPDETGDGQLSPVPESRIGRYA